MDNKPRDEGPSDLNKPTGRKTKQTYSAEDLRPEHQARADEHWVAPEGMYADIIKPGPSSDQPQAAAYFYWPRGLQDSVRSSLYRRAVRWGLPDWVHGAANTLPFLEGISTFFFGVVGAWISVTYQPWLLPVAIFTTLLWLIAFPLHWRAIYLREHRHDQQGSTVAMVFAVATCLILGTPIVVVVFAHIHDAFKPAGSAAASEAPSSSPSPMLAPEQLFGLEMRTYPNRLRDEFVVRSRPGQIIFNSSMNCLGLVGEHEPTRPLDESSFPNTLKLLTTQTPGTLATVSEGGELSHLALECYMLDYNRVVNEETYRGSRDDHAYITDFLIIVAYSTTPSGPEQYYPSEAIYGGSRFGAPLWVTNPPREMWNECCVEALQSSLKRYVDYYRAKRP
ncbi:MAG: hypothetical protein WCB99_04115 [Candidatus Cybelea sp.]